MRKTRTTRTADSALRRRLRPLHLAVALQGTLLWVPIEKLFMVDIGFTAASIGLMAAAYAAVVPLLEIPSGVLADRWSRRGVLVVAAVALLLCSLLGGLSNGVVGYVVSALFLGVYFAMYSGTVDSMVYDTVLEETGAGEGFERRIGRLRLVESLAYVASAVAGGVLAGATSPRVTYFATVPFAALSVVALLRFREPRLHRSEAPKPLREHVAVTLRTVTRHPDVRLLVVVGALGGAVVQLLFEFGPLWLVALSVSAFLYGPYWAAMTATLGLGGLLAGRLALARVRMVLAVTAVMLGAALVLVQGDAVPQVVAAQVLLVMALVVVGIHLSQRLHDAVPSAVRAGVASGVGTATWLTFLPSALVFGWVAEAHGPSVAGWLVVGLLVAIGAGMCWIAVREPRSHRAENSMEDDPASSLGSNGRSIPIGTPTEGNHP
ncbi:MFS transporter [Mumia zhuanghuii]|uniref:MFS transporter n=2 Tax=Mumia TaxID=1546255 RepID=A0ABW1QRR2_9ACTN|nr:MULTISPECIES: MFS transporter [Mumia]KAA1423763.1 MFS transporter [Mumia zhuanghuii]